MDFAHWRKLRPDVSTTVSAEQEGNRSEIDSPPWTHISCMRKPRSRKIPMHSQDQGHAARSRCPGGDSPEGITPPRLTVCGRQCGHDLHRGAWRGCEPRFPP